MTEEDVYTGTRGDNNLLGSYPLADSPEGRGHFYSLF